MARAWDSKNGRYVYSGSDRIDKSGIKDICNKIIDEADKIDKAANDRWNTLANLENVSKDLSKSSKTFKVNGRTYNTYIDPIKEEMTTAYEEIKAAAKAIKSAADSRYSTEQSQYNTYWWRIEEEKKAAQNSGNN